MDYEEFSKVFKALSDPTRLQIYDMLSCGELCACKILERFQLTQPTLSHHMKVLCQVGLVEGRREGKWIHYSQTRAGALALSLFCQQLTQAKDPCICNCREVGA